MENGLFSPGTMLGGSPEFNMDFDFLDELLLEGRLLETTGGSEFLQQSPSNSSALFDLSYFWPTSEASNGHSGICPSGKNTQEETQRPIFPDGRSLVKTQSLSQNVIDVAGCSSQSKSYLIEGSELSKRWWIGPRVTPGPASSVMERLVQALAYIKDSTEVKDALIQIWVPVNRGGKRVLTTHDQPFSFDPNCSRLANYRDISVNYQFPAEKDSKETEGLPGRVFLGKVPEWTPDVRFFRSDEYARVDFAQRYDVRGTFALPIFERGSQTCLGVIEVVMTTQKIKYFPEIENVCKTLEAVDLSSSEVLSSQNVKACDESYQAASPEILEVLKSACVTHRLPLAQTWVPCMQQGKGGCRHSNENYIHCVSTVDSACYVGDPHIWGFHEACTEHHLLKGQGVTGRAFTTNQPCFSTDITSFSKTEYPLSHHARMFGLHAAVAIRFRSVHTGEADFVLEFFLPVDCLDPEEQKKMLSSLSVTIQQVCRCLRVVTDEELEKETVSPVGDVTVPSDGGTGGIEKLKVQHTHSERYSQEESSWTARPTEVQQSDDFIPLFQKEKARELGAKYSEFGQHQQDSCLKGGNVDCSDVSTFGEGSFSSGGKTGEKRRAKAEKTITLQILHQYFAGSLKDAAKSLGVCPTTLKRICRLHGIKRWPSRKIRKVGHSLGKLQHVIDSVQGTSGAFQIGSFYSKFPELASPSLPGANPFSTSKLSNNPKSLSVQPEGGIFSPHAASKSPSSSFSQSSRSSHCSSSGMLQHPSALSVAGSEDTVVGEYPGDSVLKKVRSAADLHASNKKEPKLLPRSRSHKSLSENPNFDSLPPLQKNNGHIKVTYGEERIRFRLQKNWGYNDLVQEITRRFNIDGTGELHLKYLDDDSDWVLLTCDADLEECVDICQSSQSHTIKLSVQVSHHHMGNSMGSSSPL